MNTTTEQPGLFDRPIRSADITQNKHKGNAESVLAFETNKERHENQRREILDIVKNTGLMGATTDEIVRDHGYGIQTVSARMSELKRAGLIVKIGRRPTRSGSTAGVFTTTSEYVHQKFINGGSYANKKTN
jgi:hypothetical protein